MKTYIMRDPKAVERQTRKQNPQPSFRPPTSPVTLPGPVLFLGLDVPNDSIAVSLAPSDSTEMRRYGIIGGQHDEVLKLSKKLAAAHPALFLSGLIEFSVFRLARR